MTKPEILADPMVRISDHALVHHKLSIMRGMETNNKEFRELLVEVTRFLTYEATRNLPLKTERIITGMNLEMDAPTLNDEEMLLVVIWRAATQMVEVGMWDLLPTAKVGHFGFFRDPVTKEPHNYYKKLPRDAANREVYIGDPMLATGNTAVAAIDLLKQAGCKKIHFICMIGVPEGVTRLREAHPDVDIYMGELDEELDENAYIVKGLGDAGDRIYGTE